MARVPSSHLYDDEMRDALLGRRVPGAGVAAPMPMGAAPPMPIAPGPQVAARTPAPPMPQQRRPRIGPRDTVDPLVAEYATRLAGGAMGAKGEGAKPEAAADAGADGVGDVDPRETSTGEDVARMIDAVASGLSHHRTGLEYDPKFWQDRTDRRVAAHDKAKLERESEQQKALAAEEADPNSERSKRARMPHVGMLRQLGLQDSEIAAFSAADVRELSKGGNLGMKIAEVRQRAIADQAERQRKAAELEERRAYERSKLEESRDYDAGPKFERDKQLAHIRSGIGLNTSLKMADYHDFLARQRADEAERKRIEAEERAHARKIEDEERQRKAAGKPDPSSYVLPGTEVVDERRYRQTVTDDVQRRKLEDTVAANQKLSNGLSTMEDLRKKHGVTIDSGVTAEYNAARTMVISSLSTLAQTGVLQDREYQRYVEMLPEIRPSTKDAYRILEPGEDPGLKSVQGVARALRSTIDSGLETLGGVRLAKPGATGGKASGTSLPPDIDGDGRITVGDLQDDARPAGKSRAKAPPPASGKQRIMVGGRPFNATPEQIEQMIADGVDFEVVQ